MNKKHLSDAGNCITFSRAQFILLQGLGEKETSVAAEACLSHDGKKARDLDLI